jgi:hypothetical protein
MSLKDVTAFYLSRMGEANREPDAFYCQGVYQIGDVYARSWVIIFTCFGSVSL